MKYIKRGIVKNQVEDDGYIGFLKCFPYLFNSGYMPPIQVLNSLFEKGFCDAGMSGGAEWEPFIISDNQYFDIYNELVANGFDIKIKKHVPDWIKTINDWSVFQLEIMLGISSEFYLDMINKRSDAYAALEDAKNNGDDEKYKKIYMDIVRMSGEISDYILRHSNKKTGTESEE